MQHEQMLSLAHHFIPVIENYYDFHEKLDEHKNLSTGIACEINTY